MRESNSPVTGQTARDIRMQLWRVASNQQNEFDHQMASLRRDAKKNKRYEIVWKD
jgi:hypothetical protein